MKEIIVGCGHMGANLAMNLQRKGHEVIVIDRDEAAFAKLPKGFAGKTMVGFGIDKEVLEEAGITTADALVATTDSDETNALIARIAKRRYRVPRVIARIYDPGKADLYQSFGINTLSPSSWGVQRATDMLSYTELENVWASSDGAMQLIRYEIPPMMDGRTVSGLERMGEIKPVALYRAGQSAIPMAGTTLKAGDILFFAVMNTNLSQLKSILGLQQEKE